MKLLQKAAFAFILLASQNVFGNDVSTSVWELDSNDSEFLIDKTDSITFTRPSDSLYYYTPRENRKKIKQYAKENYSFVDRLMGHIPDSVSIHRKLKPVILPVLYTDPAVGFAFGINFQGYWRIKRDMRNQISSFRTSLIYTIYNQALFLEFWEMSLHHDRIRIRGQASYNHMPKKFFGIGNELTDNESATEFINQDYVYVNNEFNYKLTSKWYVGATMRYSYVFNTNVMKDVTFEYNENKGPYKFNTAPGCDGFMVFGIGPKITRDHRDNVKMAYKGSFFELSSLFFMGNMPYTNLTVDYRKYWTIGKRQYIGAAGYLNMNFGDVPYKEMPAFGAEFNDNLHIGRGYYDGRYMDKNLYYIQAEYRYPIYKDIRGVAFAGSGNVTDKMSQLHFDSLKFNYGAGVRFPCDKSNRVYLRIDLGFAPHESPGLCCYIGEAF